MFRSIRWNLLGWQAVILVAVVVGFGTTLFLRVRYATLEQVDADLLGAAQVVAAKLQQTGSARRIGDSRSLPTSIRHGSGRRTLSRCLGRRGPSADRVRRRPCRSSARARNFLRQKALVPSINEVEGRFEK